MEGVVEFLAYLRSLDVHLTVENGQLGCNAPKGVLRVTKMRRSSNSI